MKINFNRAALAEALDMVTSVVPARSPKPGLSCVHLIAEESQVKVCATDLEVGVICSLDKLEVEQVGQAVIPAARLTAVVRESTEEVLVMAVEENTCKIEGQDSHFTIYGQAPEQYPAAAGFEGEGQMYVGLEQLQAGIEQCLFAAARESTRYALNGVLWEAKGKKLLLVATDGRRLARTRVNLVSAPQDTAAAKRVIVPAKTMRLLCKMVCKGDEEAVAIRLAGNRIQIRYNDIVVSSNLVEGTFPKYEEIIPTGCDKKLLLPTEAVLSAVRRSALLTSEESRGIRLAVSKNRLVFTCSAPEAGDAQITMGTDYEGKEPEIGFNPQFLLDVLRVIRTESFEMELSEADRPGLIKSGKDFLYVLMPISLS